MPLPIANLDDRTFADLVAEGRAMIPRLAPGWTNHNPSDPGITLLELLAWLTEANLYDLNQVRDESYRVFLSLVGSAVLPGENLEDATARAVRSLATRSRAASPDDFEALALELGGVLVARARMVPDRNLDGTSAVEEGHVSLVVLASASSVGLSDPAARSCPNLNVAMSSPPVLALLDAIRDSLSTRLLVTTVLHVVPPGFVPVTVSVRLVKLPDASPTRLAQDAEAALRHFLDPYVGGDQGAGWPFGRPVYKSELFQRLAAVPGVDHVGEIIVNDDPTDNPVSLEPHQLVCVVSISVAVQSGGEP